MFVFKDGRIKLGQKRVCEERSAFVFDGTMINIDVDGNELREYYHLGDKVDKLTDSE